MTSWRPAGCIRSPRSRETKAKRYVERLSRLAFVTPAIVEAICQGQQPAELNAETLLNRIDLPLEWPAQCNALGIKQGAVFSCAELTPFLGHSDPID